MSQGYYSYSSATNMRSEAGSNKKSRRVQQREEKEKEKKKLTSVAADGLKQPRHDVLVSSSKQKENKSAKRPKDVKSPADVAAADADKPVSSLNNDYKRGHLMHSANRSS